MICTYHYVRVYYVLLCNYVWDEDSLHVFNLHVKKDRQTIEVGDRIYQVSCLQLQKKEIHTVSVFESTSLFSK